MALSKSTVVSVKELPRDDQAMMQAMAAVELYRAQREVANYFELAYLKLENMPDAAREVRMTANNARTQHLMTAGLMKKFTVTASQIVGTIIPMILDAVDLEDPDIVIDCFASILDMADNMKKEAEDTQKRYICIQDQVQRNLATLTEKNKQIMVDERIRAIVKEREKEMLKAAHLKEKQLQDEKRKMDEELKMIQSQRDHMMEESEKTLRLKEEADDDKTFLDIALVPAIALGGGMGAVFGAFKTGVNIFKSIFERRQEQNRVKAVQKAWKEAQGRVDNIFVRNQEVIGIIHTERVDALNRLAKIKELALADGGIGDTESLHEALAHLGDVDKQFTRIIQFWTSMAAFLMYLKDKTQGGEVYLKKIENPKYSERFKKSLARGEEGWTNFGRICSDYISVSNTEINTLYAFLSAPIDKMRAAERKTRMKQLLQGIEDDIYNTYPQE